MDGEVEVRGNRGVVEVWSGMNEVVGNVTGPEILTRIEVDVGGMLEDVFRDMVLV